MKKKIPVAILGATGSVGQRFMQILKNHPWFIVEELAASDRTAGKKYCEAVEWILPEPLDERLSNKKIKLCKPNLNSKVVFSSLNSSAAKDIEVEFAKKGYIVISNAGSHRYDSDVPLIIPEVNPEHLILIKRQSWKGAIITNPNCSTIGLVLALKPLHDKYGIKNINVVTMQAVSGGGYPGISSMDILGNVIPYIKDEENKMTIEPQKIFGSVDGNRVKYSSIKVSAQCNRVNVIDGHTECVQVSLKKSTTPEKIINDWKTFKSSPQLLKLPSAPENPIIYSSNPFYPQPRLHRNLNGGMSVAVGRLRNDIFFDYKFVILSHNTIRGAAGGTILIAELLKAKGYLD